MTNFSVITLAAGKGKRMKNPDLPKVLHQIISKPIIYYVLEQVKILSPEKNVIVIGHHGDLVKDYVNRAGYEKIEFVYQHEQLGTGHAVDMAREHFNDYQGNILILAGDVPNLTAVTLRKFIENHFENNSLASVLTTTAPDPTGYGRIIRDSEGNFLKIVEHKDASDEHRKISEINSGIFFIKSELLFESLKKIKNNNAQCEYYLTDIVEILISEGISFKAFNIADFNEIQGVNTIEELTKAEEYLLKKINEGKNV